MIKAEIVGLSSILTLEEGDTDCVAQAKRIIERCKKLNINPKAELESYIYQLLEASTEDVAHINIEIDGVKVKEF